MAHEAMRCGLLTPLIPLRACGQVKNLEPDTDQIQVSRARHRSGM